MFGKFLPKETLFFDIFEQHANIMVRSAHTFLEYMLMDQIDFQANFNPIKALEHQADELTYSCMQNLHKSFITPLQQNDIMRLISCMDDVVDCIDEAFEDCLIYKISSTPASQEMARLLVLATQELESSIKGLRDRKKMAVVMRENNLQIHRLENEADDVLRKVLGKLFDEENDIKLLIKWKEVYEVLECAMDKCEDVSNIIEGIILEYD
jgi:uncharacterized protein Yka (UPF0111/DUF47 family)